MRISTWNVNSVRVRAELLSEFLRKSDIDVILLQEIKCPTEKFPKEYFEDLGYNCLVFGQRSYNGVAILSRYNIELITRGDKIFTMNNQARYIEAFTNGIVVASVYVPNGQEVNNSAYDYKLDFLSILKGHLLEVLSDDRNKFIIGGDFNIARTDLDVYDPDLWQGRVCCTSEERKLLEEIIDLGLNDCVRSYYGNGKAIYTWWDYKRYGFAKNRGLRLDYLLSTPNISVTSCHVDMEMRVRERPSDHASVIMDIA